MLFMLLTNCIIINLRYTRNREFCVLLDPDYTVVMATKNKTYQRTKSDKTKRRLQTSFN